MTAYVLVEGHGEVDAVEALLARLTAGGRLRYRPMRAPGVHERDGLVRFAELIRRKSDAEALLVLRDDEDGCPREDGPRDAAVLRALALPFPAALVLAYREYESLFLASLEELAGRSLAAPGGLERPGLRPGARYDDDLETRRGVKEWLTRHMASGSAYKPTVDQLPLTRMVSFDAVRRSGLKWFGTLERALAFLERESGGERGRVYPPPLAVL